MDFVDVMARIGVALGLGLLVGMQREYAKQNDLDDLLGGARTFSLISISGATAALLSEQTGQPLILATIALVVSILLAIGYHAGTKNGEIGLTTEMAAIITFTGGALAGFDELPIATALGVLTATVLAVKPFTRKLSARIGQEDVFATLKFAIVAALALPLLPDTTFGPSPWDAVSPYNVGLMIVFISGLSFVGYILIKAVGPQRGIGLTGILGGLVSSTAATMTLSERSRSNESLSQVLGLGVLLAWVIMFGRVLIEVGVVNAALLPQVWLPVTAGGLFAAGWAGSLYFRDDGLTAESPGHGGSFSNPFRLVPAIQIGLLYGAVLIGSKSLDMWLGSTGIYVGAIASGLADVDAITLSMSQLSGDGSIDPATASNAIVLATAANTAVKAGIVWATGSARIRKAVLPGALGAIVLSVALAFLV